MGQFFTTSNLKEGCRERKVRERKVTSTFNGNACVRNRYENRVSAAGVKFWRRGMAKVSSRGMPRTARAAEGGLIYHVLNRGNDRKQLFFKPADYIAFLVLLVEGLTHADVEVLAFCVMPNHWHLVLQPRGPHGPCKVPRLGNEHTCQAAPRVLPHDRAGARLSGAL
jgi:putative transposase